MPSSPSNAAKDGAYDPAQIKHTHFAAHRMDARRLPPRPLAAPAGAASRHGKPATIATANRRRKPGVGPGSAPCGLRTSFPRHAAGKRHLALHHHVRQQGGEA